MDQSAIHAIHRILLAGAVLAPQEGAIGTLVPEGMKFQDLEPYGDQRRRYRGKFVTRALSDFETYLCTHVNADDADKIHCYVDADNATATVYLNAGDATAPGHCDHTATLKLHHTAAYAAVLAVTSKGAMTQRDVVDFLEDWPKAVTPVFPATDDQGPATMQRALAAVRNIDIKAEATTGNEVGNMSETRSGLAKIAATSKHVLPEAFEFTCRPFPELEERTLVLELLVHTSGDKPALKLRLRERERLVEDIADETAKVIGDHLPDGMVALVGTFTP